MPSPPRIYNLFPPWAGSVEKWSRWLPNIASMGFDTVYLNPFQRSSGNLYALRDHRRVAGRFRGGANLDDETLLRRFVEDAANHSLNVMMDLVVTHTAPDAALVEEHPQWFVRDPDGKPILADLGGSPVALLDWQGPLREAIARYFADTVRHYAELGFRGFRCVSATAVPAEAWHAIIDAARGVRSDSFFCGEALGRPPDELWGLQGAGFDYLFNSVKWWDGSAPWFFDQQEVYRQVAPSIGFPESHDTPRLATDLAGQGMVDREAQEREYRRRYLLASLLSTGIMMPMGYESGSERPLDVRLPGDADAEVPLQGNFDLSDFLRDANKLKEDIPALGEEGPMTRLSRPDQPTLLIARWTRSGEELVFVLINNDHGQERSVGLDDGLAVVTEGLLELREVTPGGKGRRLPLPSVSLRPAEVRVFHATLVQRRREPAVEPRPAGSPPPRIVIETIAPQIGDGRHPAKRVIGDELVVGADVFRDGHDKIAAALRVQQYGEEDWTVVPMRYSYNEDRWEARAPLSRVGRARYTVEAWTDHFASWADEVRKKRAAGQGLAIELEEGRELVAQAADRAESGLQRQLEAILRHHDALLSEAARADLLLSRVVAHAMALAPDKSDRVLHEPYLDLMVDREAARFSAWYEMFPRSQGTQPGRWATLDDCAARLPELRNQGFDVLYLVPIHPIGEVNRKGRNNAETAGPGDPGSPYAIGSRFGGHMAVDPNLGTLSDFRRFQRQVREHGMELALDFAVQCAPDHPWIAEHPGWFRRRPDGSIKYAENPPKKYQDIVNLDFDQPDWRGLWQALLEVVLFWVDEGVRIFRVDNPHTKPVAFWQWLIAEVQKEHPDVLFLAEAFTRPKMMRQLAKVGFSQSYSYFTWRNTKAELTEYLTELTRTESVEYYRPNFFANTPDILPFYLQNSGRAGFRIRLVLAATLSGAYGIYNGFELCEARALPGREEYADSEKYDFKVWDWDRPGNIKEDVARLNHLRRASPALRLFANLDFHQASHDSVLFYSKMTPDRRDIVFVAVTLDPYNDVRSEIIFPLAAMGLGEGDTFETEELFSGGRHRWTGARHVVSFDPGAQPAMVLRVVNPKP